MERRKKCPSDKDKFGRLYFKWKLFAIKSPGKWDAFTGEKTLDSAVGSEKNPTKIQETVVDSPGNENGGRCKLAKRMAPKVKIQQIIQCVGGELERDSVRYRGNPGKPHEVLKRNGGGFVESDEKQNG